MIIRRMRSNLRCMMIGGIVGVTAATLLNNMDSTQNRIRRIRRNAANITSRVTRTAGDTISSMGDNLARKMR